MLQERGARFTQARRKVFEILLTDHKAMGAYAIAEQLAEAGLSAQPVVAYRALDFGTESRIYEQLENSVDGDLLESLYLQLNESQKLKEQGGAVARVRDVSYGDQEKLSAGDAIEQPGFRFRSEWTVSGTVEHWGHIHERQNQFCAVFSVEPKNGLWKITDMQVESQESQILKPRLRRF